VRCVTIAKYDEDRTWVLGRMRPRFGRKRLEGAGEEEEEEGEEEEEEEKEEEEERRRRRREMRLRKLIEIVSLSMRTR
jgi:hypothetical protein